MPFSEITSKDVFRHPAPYSMATLASGSRTLHISGQVPQDETGATLAAGDAYAQTMQALRNIEAIVKTAGGTLADICALTIYMTRREDLPAVMKARAELLTSPYPATTAIVVAELANPDWTVEIQAQAALD